MERSKADSFTAYLEYKQQLDKQQSPPAAGGTAFSILLALAAGGQILKAPELQAASSMSLFDFAEALKRLQTVGYVRLTGSPGQEIVELTRFGAETASLMRPV